jgi:hypothetical protein
MQPEQIEQIVLNLLQECGAVTGQAGLDQLAERIPANPDYCRQILYDARKRRLVRSTNPKGGRGKFTTFLLTRKGVRHVCSG